MYKTLGRYLKRPSKEVQSVVTTISLTPTSYNPFPEHSLALKEIPQISKLPSKPSTYKNREREEMRKWVKNFRPVL